MMNDEELEGYLLRNATNGNWSNVFRKYSEDCRAHKAEITKSKDTALHVAAFGHQEEIVSTLIHIICNFNYTDDDRKSVVGKKNEKLNTPLHIAASLGHVRMCKDIASVNPFLVDIRNGDGETPLFMAALYGHKTSFLCLHSFCCSNKTRVLANSRRTNGDSVLHCAITNKHFDLAFQIADLNNEIVHWKDGKGLTPLHLLASKPSAFRSGSNIGGWKRVVYYCTFVDELKPESTGFSQALINKNVQTNQTSYPENYRTCIHFFRLLWEGFLGVTNWKRVVMKKKKNQIKNDKANKDEEANPSDTDKVDESSGTSHEKRSFPENYDTCFNFVEVFCKAILIILGFGILTEIKSIRKKKEKHTWSNQLLEKFVEIAAIYKYGDDGSTPLNTKLEYDETRPYIFNQNGSALLNIEELKEDSLKGNKDQSGKTKPVKKETPVLIAAKNGVVEIVKKILDRFPVSIYDMNEEKKNVVLLAAEHRQPHVFNLLLDNRLQNESVFRQVDQNGNSALHLAANLATYYKPWRTSEDALQLQWELKWYQFIKKKMAPDYFFQHNKEVETPANIFLESHKDMAFRGQQWLTSVSGSCSIVSGIIAAAAFSISANIPDKEKPSSSHNETVSTILSISSLLALCYSVTSIIIFLAIQLSTNKPKNFYQDLHVKLLVGLLSLYASIAAMMTYVGAAYIFVLKDKLKYVVLLVSAVSWLPFTLGHLPLIVDLFRLNVSTMPNRPY